MNITWVDETSDLLFVCDNSKCMCFMCTEKELEEETVYTNKHNIRLLQNT